MTTIFPVSFPNASAPPSSPALDTAVAISRPHVATAGTLSSGGPEEEPAVDPVRAAAGLHPNTVWTSEHEKALASCVGSGLSYSQSATAINDQFGTTYTRNATVGKGFRLRLLAIHKPRMPKKKRYQPYKPRPKRPPAFEPIEVVQVRCEELIPRGLTLLELEPSDCRWPYGDGPFLHCGMPKLDGSSYCSGHFALSRRAGS